MTLSLSQVARRTTVSTVVELVDGQRIPVELRKPVGDDRDRCLLRIQDLQRQPDIPTMNSVYRDLIRFVVPFDEEPTDIAIDRFVGNLAGGYSAPFMRDVLEAVIGQRAATDGPEDDLPFSSAD